MDLLNDTVKSQLSKLGLTADDITLSGKLINGTSLNDLLLSVKQQQLIKDALLNQTALDATSLPETALNKTSLNGTSLDGTSLNGTSLDGTSLNGTGLNDTLEITFKNKTASPHDTVSFSDPHLKPVYIVTGIAAAIFIFGPFFIRKGPNRGITRWCLQLTVVCCYLLWVSIYLGQMNPLIGPRMSNTSLAWVGYCWGEDAKKLEEAAADELNGTLSVTNGTLSDTNETISEVGGGGGDNDEKVETEEKGEHEEPTSERLTDGVDAVDRRSNQNPELPSFRVY